AARLPEEVADAGGADADQRLDELRARQREEVRVRLAGDRAREQRLAGPGRAGQDHALRCTGAPEGVLLRRLEVVADLAQLEERLRRARDVAERELAGAGLLAASRPARERGERCTALLARQDREGRKERDQDQDRQQELHHELERRL